jgi:hypothetical protein
MAFLHHAPQQQERRLGVPRGVVDEPRHGASLTRFKGVRTHMQTWLQVMERLLELSATPGGGVPFRRVGASGPTTISTTVNLYSHVTETMQADAAARVDAAFRVAKARLKAQK